MDISALPTLLAIAWLTPLASFTVIVLLGKSLGPHGKYAGYISVGAIVISTMMSFLAMFGAWLPNHPLAGAAHHGGAHGAPDHDKGGGARGGEAAEGGHEDHSAYRRLSAPPVSLVQSPEVTLASLQHDGDEAALPPAALPSETAADAAHGQKHEMYGDWYLLGQWGRLKITIGYYIDALTVTMFCMVSLIAACVHVYALGYMHDELHDPYVDHEVHVHDGGHLHRPGRFHRFFQYLSLFSFSMLGIVIAGNMLMVFIFWELVGICSYFLIGFYIERQSASTAANKAFIVNRVGDFGMLIGMMALWASLGTFAFGDLKNAEGEVVERGVFSLLRTEENEHRLVPPPQMAAEGARTFSFEADDLSQAGYWLLLLAGVGIFCGCVGKSAQFPLHVWLPDAMEGPTPVSALVHSATMVAAGVYLVGRFYPAFTPEVLLVIAAVGCITLALAATIAITAVDIKRVLAYSTVSQLGYMMLALGLGGWTAGLFHLITHAFFKSLLFLCSGSVIHAVHTNDMREMGGLRHKMPVTAYTMLVGCLAIIGAGVPLTYYGLSGYYSKDAIIEQAWSYARTNGGAYWLLLAMPVVGAAVTAFYMFRLWYMTFAGEPRNKHRYDHAHESPAVMTRPLVLLAVMAVAVAWSFPFSNLSITNLLAQAQPAGTLADHHGTLLPSLEVPSELDSHAEEIKLRAGLAAFGAAATGLLMATAIYLWRMLNPAEIAHTFRPIYALFWNKWYFDELYQAALIRPTMFIGRQIAGFDRGIIDEIIHALAWLARGVAKVFGGLFDQTIVDGSVNTFANWTWDFGLLLRRLQTGSLRQYVLFIVAGTLVLFVAVSTVQWLAYS